ncbi:MAG: 16S rRNA (cytidine(1402)-2'-O)-methyltransferase [Patescibacteria group bacterium]|nr:16S rRNA (cytidine(1402)-2'-O)-methyltransferase [Patescibacteria group bacterium]
MLYIVATPIGNLEDITLRALRILKEVDYILCEDTRVTARLLAHYKIYPVKSTTGGSPEAKFDRVKGKKLIAYHQHTDERKIKEIVKLVENNNVALVTDAGTPGISDPGNRLINELLTPFRGGGNETSAKAGRNFRIEPIPGACALVTALSISGLPTDKFIFKGFVPHKKGRETFLKEVIASAETVVYYDSPYRIIKNLEKIRDLLAGIRDGFAKPKHFIVCRELTKKFETIYRGSAEEILAEIKKEFHEGTPKGEFVVVAG